MLGLGPTEIIVIVVIALLILGPAKFPGFARSAGKSLLEFRSMKDDLTRSASFSLDDPRKRPGRYDYPEEEGRYLMERTPEERAASPAPASDSSPEPSSANAASPTQSTTASPDPVVEPQRAEGDPPQRG